MLIPILISEHGDMIEGYPSFSGISNNTDETELNTCVGVHMVCNGWIDINTTSVTHKALTCRKCKMRIVIPLEIKTFGDLRKHFAWLHGVTRIKPK